MRPPRRSRLVALVLGCLLLGACQSPTLPLPPPNEPDYLATPDGQHTEIIGGPGSAIPGALLMVFNVDVGEGVIVTVGSRGEFSARIETSFAAAPVNTVEIWQRHGRADSPSITKLVREPGTR